MNIMNGGFIFVCKNGSLGKSEYIDGKSLDIIPMKKRNHDYLPLIIRCGDCDALMNFASGSKDELDGKWVCPVCGVTVNEDVAYQELNEENKAYLKENDLY